MSNPDAVTVKILGKEYRVACPPGERKALLNSATLLNERMEAIRGQGKVISGERLAVIAGLNLAADLLNSRNDKEDYIRSVDASVQSLHERIQDALDPTPPPSEIAL